MSTAVVSSFELCHHGTSFTYFLSGLQYYAPYAVQFALIGVSLNKRDAFLFLVTGFYTWGLYYLMLVISEMAVKSPRPFFVHECDRSYAVPDPWLVVTASLVFTLLVSALLYRKRTFWRVLTIVGIGIMGAFYMAAPLVNNYLHLWQWFANVAIVVVLVLLVNLFVWAFVLDLVEWIMRWEWMTSLGFENCFLGEHYRRKRHKRSAQALQQIKERRTNWLQPTSNKPENIVYQVLWCVCVC